MPAYNEAGRLESTLRGIIAHMDAAGGDFEVLVVDDGSSDGTPEVAARFASRDPRVRVLANPANRGKGYSVRRGMMEAGGDAVLMTDADLSTPIEEYDALLEYLDEYDLVMASRSLPGSRVLVHQPAYREAMGRMFNLLVQVFLLRGIIDTQCGFKLMKSGVARDVAPLLRIDRFSFDVELILAARRRGYRVVDVPVRWVNSPRSRVHPVRDSLNMMLDLCRIKLYDIAGFYKKGIERE